MSVDEATTILLSNGFSGAPVVDDFQNLIAVVSSFDFLEMEAFEGAVLPMEGSVEQVEGYVGAAKRICAQLVADIMSPNPLSVSPDESMRTAAALMSSEKLHRLPVIDAHGKVVGIITASDVMQDMLHLVRNLPEARNDGVSP
eukprot:CAMPEP_0119015388 /NCGR_PEP_ID=MMETSP1176-20130426/10942_1 /TAXON_ID=265551 /ORGANISM="Synedropsis recta cf, Strain CCMP1620" /LENGTH=142 /DNA_ID=CAMNT_0006968679 /DNA_START=198 /DNA_END=626 /DNA_ORIENTATION=-